MERLNILVAEDNKLNQKIVLFILQKKGAEITIANNGAEAVELLQQNQFDAVLLDLHMPVMDGYEAARKIRTELHSSIPIIALTASISFEDDTDCQKAGINACISKPFDPDKLWTLLHELINANKKLSTIN